MERKLAFIFDHNKCIICNACVEACNKAYSLPENVNWRKLPTFQVNESKTALSISCNHCDNPTCMKACPALAYSKDEDTGIVWIDEKKCIGCGYCAWACPYESPQMSPEGVMTKCHFCKPRIDQGKGIPYCVEACPTGALSFGWVEKGKADANYLANEEITKPRLVIIPPKEITLNASPLKVGKERKYLSLLLFTIFSEIALGYSFFSLLFKLPNPSIILSAFLLASLIPSIFHIERMERAYRVIFNLKTSWLSREVTSASLALLFSLSSIIVPQFLLLGFLFTFISVISSIMIYILKARPSWYDADTFVSFLGSSMTITIPIISLILSYYLILLIPIITLILEVASSILRWRKLERIKGIKISIRNRVVLNLISIALISLSLLVPYLLIVSSITSLFSEILYRIKFYREVIYYGIPS